MTKAHFILFSFFSLGFGAIQPGPCPHKPGELKTLMNMESEKPDSGKLHAFLGPWMVMVEEKQQAEQITCPGTRFDQIDEKVLRLSQSYFIPRSKRRSKNADDEYLIHMNDLLHFRHADPTVGFIENSDHFSKIDDMLKNLKKDEVNYQLFDS